MLAKRAWIVILTMPLIATSISCVSGPLVLIETDPLPVGRMMAIGATFERQGRFVQARYVYEQVLEQDPVSPAAERLLSVIAAQEVLDAKNLPVDRLMSVGEFYERHGNLTMAQGVYKQILQREPGFEPARDRLNVIKEHLDRKLAHTPTPRPVNVRPQIHPISVPAPNYSQQRTVSSNDPPPSEVIEVSFETPIESTSNAPLVTPAYAETMVTVAVNDPSVPPSPSDGPRPSPPDSGSTFLTATESRVAELWRDKSLGDLKASITLKFPDSEKLRDTERERLSQAAPYMASHGSVTQTIGLGRNWLLSNYEWEAPATRHLPLFFEDANLERMGYTYGCYWKCCGYESPACMSECLQPIVSGAHFFSHIVLIPYIWGVDDPCEPVYTLGVDRPGSPVPYRTHMLPVSLRGAIYEAGIVTGLCYAIP